MSRIITSSHNADETLSRTAALISERMQVDASSIYIYDVSQNLLILKATHGLNPKVVEEVKMSPSEGLVGLVHETREAVQASKMQDHPRFKHFPQTNESRFSSFWGCLWWSIENPLALSLRIQRTPGFLLIMRLNF